MDKVFILLLFLSLQFYFSCTPSSKAPAGKEIISSESPKIEQGRPSWQMEWDRNLSEAKKEGKVILYNSWMPPLRDAISKAFKDRYGIELQSVSGRTSELAEKILRERKAGIYNADLFSGGSTTMTITFKPAGILETVAPLLLLPEVNDLSLWWLGKLNFVDKDRLILNFMASPEGDDIVFNTELARREEFKSLQDLLNPKWNGKIAMYDPTRPGRAQQATAMISQTIGWDYWRDFAKQKPVITVDQRLVVEWVAKGKYPVGLFFQDVIMASFKEMGAPIDGVWFPESQYLSGSVGHIALFKNAPNPAARKVFVNWLLTKEGQTIFSRINVSQSTRTDVPADHLPASIVRKEGVKYASAISEEWTLSTRLEAQKLQTEIFGPLLK